MIERDVMLGPIYNGVCLFGGIQCLSVMLSSARDARW